jgi:hypothetical protein
MQIPIRAIELAITEGWQPEGFPLTEEPAEDIEVGIVEPTNDDPYPIRFSNREYPEEGYYFSTDAEHIVLDPKFFQALGKALGWGETEIYRWDGEPLLTMYWKFQATQYFDLLMTGGSTEKFWKQLISNK